MKKDKLKIEEIVVEHIIDKCADVSYLGEYTDEYPGEDALHRGSAFDRGHGERLTHEYQYFVCTISVEEHRQGLVKLGCSKGNAEEMARRYCRGDYERVESLSIGDWNFIGIQAKAVVSYPIGNGSRRLEAFTSSGLWGIESDGGSDYIESVEREEIEGLRNHLSHFDVDLSNFDALAEDQIGVN